MFDFEEYQRIKKNIDFLGKNTEIIAISKNHPLEDVKKAISCGLLVFGENRVQEAELKFGDIKKRNNNIKRVVGRKINGEELMIVVVMKIQIVIVQKMIIIKENIMNQNVAPYLIKRKNTV